MSNSYCKTCNTENHLLSIKCEQCKTKLPQQNVDSIENELENDFFDIDYAEMKGNIIKFENLEEFPEASVRLDNKKNENNMIVYTYKEEPEFQLDSDIDTSLQRQSDEHKNNPCPECNKSFKRKSALLSHLKAAHGSSDSEDELLKPQTSRSPTKTEIPKRDLKTHPTIPHPPKLKQFNSLNNISKCDLCNDFFTSIEQLESHRIECAKKEKFFCDICNVFINSKPALTKHQQSKQHNEIKNNPSADHALKFFCIFCGESFHLQILLTNHKKVHTLDEKKVGRLKEYICNICGASSPNKFAHIRHLRVHKKEKEKSYECNLCGSKFLRNSYLILHMNLHSDERPFKCEICDMTYRHKKNLKKHLFRHTGQRPFKCEYCGKTFALQFSFNDHVRLRHTGETPYVCQVCKESFRTSYLLNLHRRKIHNIDTNVRGRVKIFNKTGS